MEAVRQGQVTTEATRTKSPILDLGHSLSAFLAQLGLQVTGGRKGTITVLRRQLDMLFRAAISCNYVPLSYSFHP